MRHYAVLLYIASFFFIGFCSSTSYYDLLGLKKDSTDQEIRRAFKKLALALHPDKNKDDPEAHEKFMKMKQAYEVLKDSDLRRKYDLYGEKGVEEGSNNQFHSWSFYEKSFGLYDEDDDVVILTSADFFQSVTSSGDFWFVNFYSPGCSHCHTIAPTWREFAAGMNGVIRVGVVNCQEHWDVCSNNGIGSYPSLVFYPSGQQYSGSRTLEGLDNFVLSKLPKLLITVRDLMEFDLEGESHLFFFCQDRGDEECPSETTRQKLAILLDGLVTVGVVYCSATPDICEKVGILSGTAYFPSNKFTAEEAKEISSLNFREIAQEVYNMLPDLPILSAESLEAERNRLETGSGPALFVKFTESSSAGSNEDVIFRRLPALLREMKHASVDCSTFGEFCKKHRIDKFPSFGVFKVGGAFELVWGKDRLQDIVAFAKAAAKSPKLVTLTPELLNEAISQDQPWIVDFFAPWCPPCRRVLPTIREASQSVQQVRFGTLDCVKYSATCSQMGVRSYPSLVLFNNTAQYHYGGEHSADRIAEFVEDTLKPPAIQLTLETFNSLVGQKPDSELWVIDFYASWCGPCQQLKPHWAKVAKSLAALNSFVKIAEVDCVKQQVLCTRQGINSYPTIRMYPLGHVGISAFIPYSSYQRDHSSIRQWIVSMIPSSIISLDDRNFYETVTRSSSPWIVEFYLPWCQPCQVFGPHFEIAAKALQGKIGVAKVNCQHYPHVCQQAGIRSYPAVKLYPKNSGISQGRYISTRDADSVVQEVMDYLIAETPMTMHDEL